MVILLDRSTHVGAASGDKLSQYESSEHNFDPHRSAAGRLLVDSRSPGSSDAQSRLSCKERCPVRSCIQRVPNLYPCSTHDTYRDRATRNGCDWLCAKRAHSRSRNHPSRAFKADGIPDSSCRQGLASVSSSPPLRFRDYGLFPVCGALFPLSSNGSPSIRCAWLAALGGARNWRK